MGIRYLKRKEIDTGKWDRVVADSSAENLYSYSWYLDASTECWSALVKGDYDYIMPLPWKRKFGIPYFYQPIICQQLGVHAREMPDPSIVRGFIDKLPRNFRFGTLQFNRGNLVEESSGFRVWDRSNHILPLNSSYEGLKKNYSNNTRRNLNRAKSAGAELDPETSLEELMKLKSRVDRPERNRAWYEQVGGQLQAILQYGEGRILGLREGGELRAAVFFARTRSRIIYLMPVSSPEGKEERAMFRIVDHMVRENAESGLTLDFEGSDIPGIARFFTGFGAAAETYQALDVRRFPFSMLKQGGHEGEDA